MPQGKNRTLQVLQTFLRKRLLQKLRRDLKRLRIVKEADVECAAYFHIRRFLGEDPRWRVLARRYVSRTGHYVDLLIFKGERPTIAVELKWGRKKIGRKDRKSLIGALEKLGVNKAYWLSALSSVSPRDPIVKDQKEKYVFHQLFITPGLTGVSLERWNQRRARFRDEMRAGRGRRRAED